MVVLFDQYNMPESIFEVVFSTDQQVKVATLLVEELKRKDGSMGKTEMSMFAKALHNGTLIEGEDKKRFGKKKENEISYNKRQFYDRILTPMKTMGMVNYDMYKKKYELSEKFNKNMMKIGLMWLQELKRDPRSINIKKSDDT